MYVCIEVALCGMPMESGVQLDLGEGPIKRQAGRQVVDISQKGFNIYCI